MKKALTLVAALIALTLTLASRPAMAATALQQLGQEAGIDAAPLAQQLKAVRALAAVSAPLMIPRRSKDVFEGCSALEARSLKAWTPAQAALLVQTCLNHVYAADGAYSVHAQAARFGQRVCPDSAGQLSCQAIVEVVGIKITVSGVVLTGDSVLLDLNGSLTQRGGKLLG
ncbi:MAG: hypothetical protein KGL74_12640, partial [Elusimicrobia bacterium]|nr:hypothetical protein [Elusimicrobiota bacterium]MDE2511962.1 hypothetical protein [Elusimicrobiota bacterium]